MKPNKKIPLIIFTFCTVIGVIALIILFSGIGALFYRVPDLMETFFLLVYSLDTRWSFKKPLSPIGLFADAIRFLFTVSVYVASFPKVSLTR